MCTKPMTEHVKCDEKTHLGTPLLKLKRPKYSSRRTVWPASSESSAWEFKRLVKDERVRILVDARAVSPSSLISAPEELRRWSQSNYKLHQRTFGSNIHSQIRH